jgi:hypothetical protein
MAVHANAEIDKEQKFLRAGSGKRRRNEKKKKLQGRVKFNWKICERKCCSETHRAEEYARINAQSRDERNP